MDSLDRGTRLYLAADTAASLFDKFSDLTPENSNTGVSKRQTPSASIPQILETGGCDWFEAGLYGAWDHDGFLTLQQWFGALKCSALENELPESFELPCGTPALMHQRGVTMGCGGFEWVFEANGIKFFLVNRRWGSEDRLSVWFRATGETCMVLGHLSVFKEVLRILGVLGFIYERSSTPSRFDACVDMADHGLEEIKLAWEEGRCIKRVDKWKIEGDALDTQTIEFGRRGGEQVVFYDKMAELQGDGKAGANDRKRSYLEEHRWGCSPEKAMRVELRFRGDWLRTNTTVRSCEEFFAQLPSLIEYKLSASGKGWIKFVDTVPDRDNKHTARAELSDWWKDIIAKFLAWAGHESDKVVRPIKGGLRMRELLKQTIGCLSSLAAAQEQNFADNKQVANWLIANMGEATVPFLEQIANKENALKATRAGPSTADLDLAANLACSGL